MSNSEGQICLLLNLGAVLTDGNKKKRKGERMLENVELILFFKIFFLLKVFEEGERRNWRVK